jgi:N-acetylneuraminic acid mutarotase
MVKATSTLCATIVLTGSVQMVLAVEWEIRADIPQHVYGHGGAVVQGKLYSIGGCETADWTKTSTKVQAYDYQTDTWSKAPDTPIELGWPMVAVHHDNIYVFGGIRNGAISTDKAWKYDPENDRWTAISDLPVNSH